LQNISLQAPHPHYIHVDVNSTELCTPSYTQDQEETATTKLKTRYNTITISITINTILDTVIIVLNDSNVVVID